MKFIQLIYLFIQLPFYLFNQVILIHDENENPIDSQDQFDFIIQFPYNSTEEIEVEVDKNLLFRPIQNNDLINL